MFATAFAGKVQGEVAALVNLRLPLLFTDAGVAVEGDSSGVFLIGGGGNGSEAGEGVGGREPEGVGRQEAVFTQGVGAAVALFAPVGVLLQQRGQVVAGEVQAVWRQVVEKRRGVVVEERQVVFEALRGLSVADLPVERAVHDFFAVVQAGVLAVAGAAGVGEVEFAARQDADAA